MQSQTLTTHSPTHSYRLGFSPYSNPRPHCSNYIPRKKTQFVFPTSLSKSNKTQLPIACCSRQQAKPHSFTPALRESFDLDDAQNEYSVQVGSPAVVPKSNVVAGFSMSDKAFFLLAFIACTTSVAFASLVVAAVPTLHAMGRAATSLAKLADTAREELPSTMAAIRLSGMEISDLTLELSDLSQEIAEGVNKSAQAVQAAEAGIRKIGSYAREQTMSIIQERASLPIISLQPAVTGAAKKTSRAVGQATKSFINMISRGEFRPEIDDEVDEVDEVDF
ncbi:hypothetical protein MLD38_023647 [Melastoma candidum]|uniref:Uncharacterized protein n=1 Tax=Melastoma candidum TaxID=119954 RepID=A0ACB9NQX5_9MYRT|nr:hypothetical protein MLD38_023647 [Melastoma candidum]